MGLRLIVRDYCFVNENNWFFLGWFFHSFYCDFCLNRFLLPEFLLWIKDTIKPAIQKKWPPSAWSRYRKIFCFRWIIYWLHVVLLEIVDYFAICNWLSRNIKNSKVKYYFKMIYLRIKNMGYINIVMIMGISYVPFWKCLPKRSLWECNFILLLI